MNDVDARCLDLFPSWLKTLGADVQAVSSAVEDEATGNDARTWLLAALNYLLKSLDLIPDGIEDLGFIDDAFVLRACVARAIDSGQVDAERLKALSEELDVVEDFLEGDFARLQKFVLGLSDAAVHGITALDANSDDAKRRELLAAVAGFVRQYEAPGFAPQQRNLVKLRSFMATKLPALD